MKILQKTIVGTFLSLLIIGQVVWIDSALAHKVVVFGWVEDGNINVEAGFGSKRPAKNCVIKAYDPAQNLIYEGKTDAQGRHVFKTPASFSTDMIIELEAGTGHKGSWTIQADEFASVSDKVLVPEPQKESPVGKGTDPLRIIAGIAVIFGLALVAKRMKSKSKGGTDA